MHKTYLRSKEEAQMTASQSVLDQEGNLLGKAELHLAGQVGGLGEVDKIFEREGKGNRLGERDGDVLIWLLDIRVLTDSHRAVTDITLAGESHTFFRGLDNNYSSSVSNHQDTTQVNAQTYVRCREENKVGSPDSDRALRSLQIRWNSADGISTVEA